MLYNFNKSKLPFSVIVRLLAMVLPKFTPDALLPRAQLYDEE
jgi:hypothetical protein